MVVEDECLPPSCVSSEGGSGRETTPSISHFERGRGVVMEDQCLPPSHVSSEGGSREWAREGVGVVVEDKCLPPSRVSSEGGTDNPLRLTFQAREGVGLMQNDKISRVCNV